MPGRGALTRTFLALFLVHTLAHSQTATVEGTVLNSATHAGVPEVKVTLWTPKGARYDATTDASGAFRIAGVQPGEYRSRYEKPGFEEVDHPGFGQTPLRVGTAGSNRADADLVPFATLRGRVLDPDGKPAGHAIVEIGLSASEEADAEGRFEFRDVRPGSYWLRAGFNVGQAPPVKAPDAIVATYYPSTTNLSEAERILVRAGSDLPGYEIHLRTSPVYRLRGVVLDETGKPAPHLKVWLLGPREERLLAGRGMTGAVVEYFLNMHGVTNESSVMSGEDGTFEFPSVRPGDWSLEAELSGAKNKLHFATSSTVPAAVSDHDIENLEVRFEPAFNVEVTADWGDQQPPAANPRRGVMLVPVTHSGGVSPGGLRFEDVLPGWYRIVPTPGLPPGFYPDAIMLAGQDVLGRDVELTANTPPIRVMYKPNPGSIRGTVEQGEGATVLLWPQGPAIPDIVRAVEAGPRGAFEITQVPPGDYALVAFDRVSNQGGSESFVLGAVAAGARVKVMEGAAETVQLPLTRWPD
jgi:protocatechuate 3,4-dioxygenase beta subunit